MSAGHRTKYTASFTRFFRSASRAAGPAARARAMWLAGALVAIATFQVCAQYLLNVWNRELFDAFELRQEARVWEHVQQFVPLCGLSVALAVMAVWARMKAQRTWRAALTEQLVSRWLRHDRFRRLDPADDGTSNAEYRIVEDVRVATEIPVELGLALFTSVITAGTFLSVLWQVGGSLQFTAFGRSITIPGYLVFGVLLYAGAFTAGVIFVGKDLTRVIEDKNQAEAEFRAATTLVRELGEADAPTSEVAQAQAEMERTLPRVFVQWRVVCHQLMRTTWVSHANFLLTPVVGWGLCAPKYLAGLMTLGALTQTAAAFVVVLGAFNWLVDNFQRFADWRSSVDRVSTLMLALDDLREQRGASAASVQHAEDGRAK